MQTLSVVIPIKDERDNLLPLHRQLGEALQPLLADYEIVFVDDGSRDGSFARLQELAAVDLGPAIFLSVHLMVGGIIARAGSDAQKKRYLPALASGAMLGAFALMCTGCPARQRWDTNSFDGWRRSSRRSLPDGWLGAQDRASARSQGSASATSGS